MAHITPEDARHLIRQRGTLRGRATTDRKTVDSIFQSITSTNIEPAQQLLRRLVHHSTELQRLDAAILPFVQEADEDAEIKNAYDYQDNIDNAVAALESRIDAFKVAEAARNAPKPEIKVINNDTSGTSSQDSASARVTQHERLPEMDLPKFDGNPLDWEEFWDDFKQTVDDRTDIPSVTKFKLLRKCLIGDAAAACKNYKLTSPNYDEVKSILKERYGDRENAIALHLAELVQMDAASSHSIAELRRVRDECESHVRALVILGFKEESFGELFAPLILSKLPKYVRLDIRKQKKQAGDQVWSMQKLRKAISLEIEMRSTNEYDYFGSDDEGGKQKRHGKTHRRNSGGRLGGTADMLLTDNEGREQTKPQRQCIFCGEGHHSDHCIKYPDVASRQARLGSQICFRCLRRGLCTTGCESPAKPCFYCNSTNHHCSLCPTKFGNSHNTTTDNFFVFAQDHRCKCCTCKAKEQSKQKPSVTTSLLNVHHQGKQLHPCAFCCGIHYNAECPTYKDIASRKARLSTTACQRCFNEGHTASDCKLKNRPCYYCKQLGHNSSLCVKWFDNLCSILKPEITATWDMPSLTSSISAPPQGQVGAPNLSTDPGTVRPRRRIPVLQTALVTVKGNSAATHARILFDNGSTKSYVSEGWHAA